MTLTEVYVTYRLHAVLQGATTATTWARSPASLRALRWPWRRMRSSWLLPLGRKPCCSLSPACNRHPGPSWLLNSPHGRLLVTHASVRGACDPDTLLAEQVCDQGGAKLLQRYIQWRRLQQLMREISTLSVAKRSNAPAQASAAVDPRQVRARPSALRGLPHSLAVCHRVCWLQVEVYLEEMLLLCQRSEEYNGFMLARLESPDSQPAAVSPRVRSATT